MTKKFVNLIKQYKYENQDDFRKALLDTNTLKQKNQQMTGHKNLSSLDTYIDLAFSELFNTKTVLDNVSVANAYESFDSQLKIITLQLINKEISPIEFEKKQKELIKYKEESIKLKKDKMKNNIVTEEKIKQKIKQKIKEKDLVIYADEVNAYLVF